MDWEDLALEGISLGGRDFWKGDWPALDRAAVAAHRV
jgi:hypothetical protein